MKKHKKLHIPIYNALIYVTRCKDEAARLAVVKTGAKVDNYTFSCDACVFYGNGVQVLFLPAGASFGTLAHEVTHLVLNLFYYKGVTPDVDNQEPTAYLMGYLFQRVLDAYERLKDNG